MSYADEIAADLHANPITLHKLIGKTCSEVDSLRAQLADCHKALVREREFNHDLAIACKGNKLNASATGEAIAREDAAVLRQENHQLRDQLAALRRELDEERRDGERRFPGFSLHENPVRVQRLGFAWLDEKKQHRTVEFANYDTHPMMVANQLRGLAEAIEEAHMDKESPLGRAARPSKP